LEDLIGARNRVKKEMAQEKDKFKKELLNCRQLALKVRGGGEKRFALFSYWHGLTVEI